MTTVRNHLDVGAYYDQEPVAMAEATGAGLIWFLWGVTISVRRFQIWMNTHWIAACGVKQAVDA